MGFKIGTFGYVAINIKLFEDKKNPLKKTPKFTFYTGIILALGSLQYNFPIVDYQKSLPPFTLKFTLTQIETVLNIVK